MADLSITAANVQPANNAKIGSGTAGATITAGQAVYLDGADGKLKLADADAATTDDCVGIAVNGASDGQPIDYQSAGDLDPGGTVTVGEVYVVSTTAGGIAPLSDLLTGDFVTVIGIGTTASNIRLGLNTSSAAKP